MWLCLYQHHLDPWVTYTCIYTLSKQSFLILMMWNIASILNEMIVFTFKHRLSCNIIPHRLNLYNLNYLSDEKAISFSLAIFWSKIICRCNTYFGEIAQLKLSKEVLAIEKGTCNPITEKKQWSLKKTDQTIFFKAQLLWSLFVCF